MSAPAPAAAAAAPAATPVADTKTETKAPETKGTTTVVAAVATTWKPLVVGEQHVDDAYAEVHRLNKRVMELQRRLNKAENKAKAERAGWAPFGWRILNPHSIVSLSNGGKTATNKHGGGLLETIVGDAVFEKSVHSFRVHIEKGDNLFIGLVSAPVEGKAAEEAHPGTDYAIRDSRPKRAQFAQFVGESNGVGLNTQHGCVYVNGRMHFLGDFAVCKPGDDVGVHVNVDKHHVQFFKNGAALGRLVQLPAHPGNLVAAVSLVNLDDKVTLNFRHPEDEWAA